MTYRHTISIGRVHAIMTLVLVMCREFAQLTCDMICVTTVGLPVCINTIGCGCHICPLVVVVAIIIRIRHGVILEAPPAIRG